MFPCGVLYPSQAQLLVKKKMLVSRESLFSETREQSAQGRRAVGTVKGELERGGGEERRRGMQSRGVGCDC